MDNMEIICKSANSLPHALISSNLLFFMCYLLCVYEDVAPRSVKVIKKIGGVTEAPSRGDTYWAQPV